MTAFLALMRREFLEHRGAFLYAPAILIVLFAAFVVLSIETHHLDMLILAVPAAPDKLVDIAYLVVATLWWIYLALMLFFYFADAFHADTRNNSMLFWKSMPQSDLKVLTSKLASGLTMFPLQVFVAGAITGLLLGGVAAVVPHAVANLPVPDFANLAVSWGQMTVLFLVYLVLLLLWFAPFFAWVGVLSTFVGRWSIPLAIVVPFVIALFEGQFETSTGLNVFTGGRLLAYLQHRLDFRYDSEPLTTAALSTAPIDIPAAVGRLLAGMDWVSLVGGLLFALVALYIASLQRRRVLKG